MRSDSPEDRLLRLIKGKYKKKGDTETTVPVEEKRSILTEATKTLFLNNKIFKPSFFRSANKILAAILILAIIYLVNNFISSPYKDADTAGSDGDISDVDNDMRAARPVAAGPGDYSKYKKEIIGKELFSVQIEKKPEETAPEIDVSKRFNLVGIITGDDPQAIIEDTETQKTHYLIKGQSFSGATVLEVGEGKVVLEYGGKEIILIM
ncbi:MAG: hypothetical protein ABID09_02170 [Candidatus Omnitrophota bacterium]